ncbi:MAG: acireductone synthase [Armatimonadetes bacterium]|nr:acireductone synthase [Armatimonadota bacterium]
MSDFDAVVLDIEGTITPISFVYDTLFPYAHDHAARFLREHWHEDDVQQDVEALRDLSAVPEIPRNGDVSGMVEAAAACVHALIHEDRKVTPLKSLQGKIWKEGYERGQLRGEFYDDALRAMARWSAEGIVLAIYSSGSVEAQQLLFRHSGQGDLTDMISGWFDTTTGPKRERESYEKIAEELEIDPSRILFATDVAAEARAASEAGFQVLILARLGNPAQPPHDFRAEADFELI